MCYLGLRMVWRLSLVCLVICFCLFGGWVVLVVGWRVLGFTCGFWFWLHLVVLADFLLFYFGLVLRLLLFGVFGLEFWVCAGFGVWFDFGAVIWWFAGVFCLPDLDVCVGVLGSTVAVWIALAGCGF